MSDFIAWGDMATLAGASAVVLVVTSYLKGLWDDLPTQVLSYIVAVVVLFLSTAAAGGAADWTVWALIPFNAVLVSLAANGSYTAVTRDTYSYLEGTADDFGTHLRVAEIKECLGEMAPDVKITEK